MLDLGQEIGIFDLSGQEINQWLELEGKDVFFETNIIIVLIDVNSPFLDNLEFIHKILSVRKEICKDATIYLLIHKMDLVMEPALNEIQGKYLAELKDREGIIVEFSSIANFFYMHTLRIFIEILERIVSGEFLSVKLDFDFLKNTLIILSFLREKEQILVKEVETGLIEFKMTIGRLIERELLKLEILDGNEVLSITPSAKKYINFLIQSIALDEISSLNTNDLALKCDKPLKDAFIGLIINDSLGRPFVIVDNSEEGLKTISMMNLSNGKQYDVQLIPMFFAALKDFSKNVTPFDFNGFKLKGEKFNMYLTESGEFSLILFVNKDVLINHYESQIREFFSKFLDENKQWFQEASQKGKITNIAEIITPLSNWLRELNKKYIEQEERIKLTNFQFIKEYYDKLKDLTDKIIEK